MSSQRDIVGLDMQLIRTRNGGDPYCRHAVWLYPAIIMIIGDRTLRSLPDKRGTLGRLAKPGTGSELTPYCANIRLTSKKQLLPTNRTINRAVSDSHSEASRYLNPIKYRNNMETCVITRVI